MFEAFPKIARLKRSVIVTEKLDGTNAQVLITPAAMDAAVDPMVRVGDLCLYAGSRSRLITPGKLTDNYGFAQWVVDNAEELVKLGEGRHFGEWYGKGIQRNYGLSERRFALFNTARFGAHNPNTPACCSVVPVLNTGDFSCVEAAMSFLNCQGSIAVPGFKNPEGIVVYHSASRTMFKQTFDDKHKEAA